MVIYGVNFLVGVNVGVMDNEFVVIIVEELIVKIWVIEMDDGKVVCFKFL